MNKEEILNDVRYMQDRLVYGTFQKNYILYSSIVEYRIGFCFSYRGLLKCLFVKINNGLEYRIKISSISIGFIIVDDFEDLHIKALKKYAPQAKYIKKEKLCEKIKRKLRN